VSIRIENGGLVTAPSLGAFIIYYTWRKGNKEIELQQRSEDVKIMAMDTSAMPPIRTEYIISLQKEILAKRAGSGFNQ
jgi:hypothetical protein